MKELFLIILLLTPLAAAADNGLGLDAALLKNSAQNKLQQKKALPAGQSSASLYENVNFMLQSYYGKANFADPSKTTGWYRVDDFLKWLKENNSKLQNTEFNYQGKTVLQMINGTQSEQNVAAAYLGARYVASKYPKNLDSDPLFNIRSFDVNGWGCFNYLHEDKEIEVCDNAPLPAAGYINAGIHEMSHALCHGTNCTNSEVTPFYNTQKFGLPVKKNERAALGVRNVVHNYDSGLKDSIFTEYIEFAAGHIIFDALEKAPLQTNKDNATVRSVIYTAVKYSGAKTHEVKNAALLLDFKQYKTLHDLFDWRSFEPAQAQPNDTLENILSAQNTVIFASKNGKGRMEITKKSETQYYLACFEQITLDDILNKTAFSYLPQYDKVKGFIKDLSAQYSKYPALNNIDNYDAYKKAEAQNKELIADIFLQTLKKHSQKTPAVPQNYI
ncbi:hypothetical protein Dip510_000149 [Elusimicrobium posterum]|uniref:hypothetical protein n=1 Tax=Elusimicrobium posterum TaxID=3116653 RepID=UPI003C7315FB